MEIYLAECREKEILIRVSASRGKQADLVIGSNDEGGGKCDKRNK